MNKFFSKYLKMIIGFLVKETVEILVDKAKESKEPLNKYIDSKQKELGAFVQDTITTKIDHTQETFNSKLDSSIRTLKNKINL